MKKFVVLFSLPAAIVQKWVETVDEATRNEQSHKMMIEWKEWVAAHKDSILDEGLPLGKTKRVDGNGVTDIKNDLIWYLLVQAESHDAAAQMFVGHPHLTGIPGTFMEIMDANRSTEM
jgi:hypothetical protein